MAPSICAAPVIMFFTSGDPGSRRARSAAQLGIQRAVEIVIPRSRSSGVINFVKRLYLSATSFSEHGGDRCGQSGLTVVNVTNGTYVYMGFGSLELLFSHLFLFPRQFVNDAGTPHWSPCLQQFN